MVKLLRAKEIRFIKPEGHVLRLKYKRLGRPPKFVTIDDLMLEVKRLREALRWHKIQAKRYRKLWREATR